MRQREASSPGTPSRRLIVVEEVVVDELLEGLSTRHVPGEGRPPGNVRQVKEESHAECSKCFHSLSALLSPDKTHTSGFS